MPRVKLSSPGPGRPRLPESERRVAVNLRLRPEVWGLARSLADVAFKGNFSAAIEHCIRLGSAGLDPAERPASVSR